MAFARRAIRLMLSLESDIQGQLMDLAKQEPCGSGVAFSGGG